MKLCCSRGITAASLRDVAIREIDAVLKPLNVCLCHCRALLSGGWGGEAGNEDSEQEPALNGRHVCLSCELRTVRGAGVRSLFFEVAMVPKHK